MGSLPHPVATYGPFKCVSACAETQEEEGRGVHGGLAGQTDTHTHTCYTPDYTMSGRWKGEGLLIL